jgi:hypothetical protein
MKFHYQCKKLNDFSNTDNNERLSTNGIPIKPSAGSSNQSSKQEKRIKFIDIRKEKTIFPICL